MLSVEAAAVNELSPVCGDLIPGWSIPILRGKERERNWKREGGRGGRRGEKGGRRGRWDRGREREGEGRRGERGREEEGRGGGGREVGC